MDSVPLDPLLSCAGGSRRLTERLFAGWPRRRTRKKSHGPYETLDRCALIRSAMAKVDSLLKFACLLGSRVDVGTGCSVASSSGRSGRRRKRHDGHEGAQFSVTPRGHLPRRARSEGQLLPTLGREARPLFREGTGGGPLRPFWPSEHRPRGLLPLAVGHVP